MTKRVCSIEGCEHPHAARGVCRYHYNKIRNSGTAVTYNEVHSAIIAQRGDARLQRCIDCGGQARQWSYGYRDPNELRSETGARFSADPAQYDARCIKCHQQFDAEIRANEIKAKAVPVINDIRHAIAERKRAKRNRDDRAYAYWDEQLDKLTAPLELPDLA